MYGLYEYGGRANTSHVLMNMKHRFTTIKLLKSGLDNNNKSARRGLGPSKRQQVVVDYYSSSSTMNGLRHLSQVFYYIYLFYYFLLNSVLFRFSLQKLALCLFYVSPLSRFICLNRKLAGLDSPSLE